MKLAERPRLRHECNCSLCRKSGARWAYCRSNQASVEGETHGCSRADKAEANADLRFCPICGATTRFMLTQAAAEKFGNTMMGVNTRFADDAELAGIELRYPDGANWVGAGEFAYVRAAVVIGTA